MISSKLVHLNNAKKWSPLFRLSLMQMIHIETKTTPNPNFLKFIPSGKSVLGDQGTLDIVSKNYAEISPLAQELFGIEGITRVFYASDYVSIAKKQGLDWAILKPQIYRVMSDYFDSKKPILSPTAMLDGDDINPDDSETVQFIKQVLASRVRPTVQQDGGDVKFVQFNENTGKLILRMVGACSGCPSSSATLKNGIEKMLTYYISEVRSVEALDQ